MTAISHPHLLIFPAAQRSKIIRFDLFFRWNECYSGSTMKSPNSQELVARYLCFVSHSHYDQSATKKGFPKLTKMIIECICIFSKQINQPCEYIRKDAACCVSKIASLQPNLGVHYGGSFL